jgi:hypothetical protein
MQKQVKRWVRNAVIVHLASGCVVIAFLLFIWFRRRWKLWEFSGCYVRNSLHIYCPGCGGTRAITAFFEGHPLRAFFCYPALFVAAGVIVWCDGVLLTAAIRNSPRPLRLIRWWLILIPVACAVLFAAVRTLLAYLTGYDPLGDLTALLL